MYLPSVVMVGFYFDKKRAMATGVAVCGSGIGTFVLAPVVDLLVSEYGWKVRCNNYSTAILHSIRPHRTHAVCRCGMLQQPTDVACSVCVCVCLSLLWAQP